MAEGAADPVRIAKWTSIVVGSILLLLIATVVVMTSVIDPNRYRGKVEQIVGDLAGRPFVIEGDLHITWFPWLGVRMGPAHLSNRPGVSGPPIVEWQSVSVAAKVIPLIKGQVVVDRIRLQGPHVRLRRDMEGHGNWEGLGPRTSTAAGQKSSPQIAGIEIRDGALEYVDEKSGTQINLSSWDFDMGEWRVGAPLPIHTRFLAHAASIPPAGLLVQLDAPDLTVQTEPLNVAAPKLSIQIADTRLDGDLNYAQAADARISARGSVGVHVPSVRKLARELALDQTMPHDPTTLGPLELTTQWSYTDGALTAKPLALQLDGVKFNGWVERSAPPRSAWTFELRGDQVDLGRYLNIDTTSKKPFEIPVEELRALNANGSLIFDRAVLKESHLSDVRLKFQTPEAKP